MVLPHAARLIGTTTGSGEPPGSLSATSNRPLSTTIIGLLWKA
jgi:hypothetical protein